MGLCLPPLSVASGARCVLQHERGEGSLPVTWAREDGRGVWLRLGERYTPEQLGEWGWRFGYEVSKRE